MPRPTPPEGVIEYLEYWLADARKARQRFVGMPSGIADEYKLGCILYHDHCIGCIKRIIGVTRQIENAKGKQRRV